MADILIWNPAGLEVHEIQNLSKPCTVSVNKTELKTDRAVLKKLNNKEDREMTQENSEYNPLTTSIG